jgi:hypothetical protein
MGARLTRGLAAAAALALTATAIVIGAPNSGSAATVPSLQAFSLVKPGMVMSAFKTDTPEQQDWVRRVTGLVGDKRLLGIDMRVQDGKLYALGDQGGIYTIAIPTVVTTKVSQLTVPLYGTSFGFDFNPAADRLRIVSDNGQNLRHNLNDHTTTEDTTLTTPPATGPQKGVTASAYTNNDLNGDTATTLFGINTITDQVVIQSPANNGLLAPTGKLGFDAGLDTGFDIFSTVTNGKTTSNMAFASLTDPTGSVTTFFSVELLTGAATPIGDFPLPMDDVAISLTGS